MRQTRPKRTASPLSASSLTELRSLQKQAAKQAAQRARDQRAHALRNAAADGPDGYRNPACPGSGVSAQNTSPATLSDQDIALFRRVMQTVTPRRPDNRAALPPVPAATPAQLRQRRQHAMGQPVSNPLTVSDHYTAAGIQHNDTMFVQAGHGPHLIKGLKKGKWPIQASLDLHGSTLDDARERLNRFIQSCRDHQIRCVCIVHGKGYGSHKGNPVLKETVRRWLSQLTMVQAYIEASESDGGAGAVLVLLSKKES